MVANLLLGAEADGAIVIKGHESLAGTEGVYFHPKNGKYAIIRPGGQVVRCEIGL